MVLDLFRMDDRVALITGASRGIGAATAQALASCGADVVVSARDAETLDGLARKVEAETGRRVVCVPADLNELDSLPALVQAAKDAFGRIDVLVNNVGGTSPRPLLNTSPGYLERAFHWNVTVGFELTKLCAPAMLEAGKGSVVNISSAIGHLADRGFVAYATAKGALDHLTRQLAVDLAPKIRVNAVAPGSIETDALATVINDDMRATMISMTPMRRLGRPEDIAAAVVYLASDAASFVTGKILQVDGGMNTPNLPLGLPDL